MEYAKMNGLNRDASRIGLGTWSIGGFMWGGTDEQEALATIQLTPIVDVDGWKLDLAALKAIDEIVRDSVTDPVGPEFMAPPARSLAVAQSLSA